MNKMRHIVTDQESPIFLTAEFEKRIYSWNINTYELLSKFDSILDFGGQRLAIGKDGTQCIAASYGGCGVSMYDVLTGSEIWRRKDINKVQFVTFDFLNKNKKIYVGAERKPLLILNADDGSDDSKLSSTTKIYFDSWSSKRFLLKGKNTVSSDGFNITSPTFAFLDVQGIGKGVVLSAVCNDLIYYDYNEKKIKWKVSPQKNEYFLKVSYV